MGQFPDDFAVPPTIGSSVAVAVALSSTQRQTSPDSAYDLLSEIMRRVNTQHNETEYIRF
jgi:hypothetical protein